MRKGWIVAGSAFVGLFLSSAASALDKPASQVIVEAKIVEASRTGALELGLWGGGGFAFGDADGGYSSTGRQAAGEGSGGGTGGSGGIGADLWIGTGLGSATPAGGFGLGGLDVGLGAGYHRLFGTKGQVFGLSRHQGGGTATDVALDRELISTLEVTASARVRLLFAPKVSTGEGKAANTIVIDVIPTVGYARTASELDFRSDQTHFGGQVLESGGSKSSGGLVAGIGVETPLLKIGIPVLGGLFFSARQVPGREVTIASPFGFTETAKTDDSLLIFIQARIIVPIDLN